MGWNITEKGHNWGITFMGWNITDKEISRVQGLENNQIMLVP